MNNKITFNLIIHLIKKILVLNGIVLLLMTIFRYIFFVYFADFADFKGLYDYLLKAFILGVRYDLVVIAYINTLVTLSLFIIWSLRRVSFIKVWQTFVKYYYFTMFTLVFLILIVDFGFYTYFKNHINIIIFGIIEDDTRALFSTIFENYNVSLVILGFILLFITIYFICHYVLKSINIEKNYQQRYYKLGYKIGFVLLILSINILSARGSFGLFPLGVMDAAISPNIFINKLSLNGIHTFYEAFESRLKENRSYDLIKAAGYNNRIEQAFSDFLNMPIEQLDKKYLCRSLIKTSPKNTNIDRLKPNVVLIMMEGFGSDLLKYNSESFNVMGELKRHFDSDYVFYRFLSGDIGTIGSLESVLLNMPKRPQTKSIAQSKYAFNKHPSAAALPYKQSGYDTVFLYAGRVSWRNMDTFAPTLGFNIVEGEGAMDPKYVKNQWGVFDEYLFDHIYKKLSNKNGKSKFIFALTTGNHPPYSLPSSYKKLPLVINEKMDKMITGDKNLSKKRFLTYQYANQKLGEFISKIKKSEFADNTIIAVTGDHNFWGVFDYAAEDIFKFFAVPLYVYVPEKIRPKYVNTEVAGSHVDIMPTLYNLSLSDKKCLSLGNDLFSKNSDHIAFNSQGFIISEYCAVSCFLKNDSCSYYYWDSEDKKVLRETNETGKFKSMLKYYKSSLALSDFILKNQFDIEDESEILVAQGN